MSCLFDVNLYKGRAFRDKKDKKDKKTKTTKRTKKTRGQDKRVMLIRQKKLKRRHGRPERHF